MSGQPGPPTPPAPAPIVVVKATPTSIDLGLLTMTMTVLTDDGVVRVLELPITVTAAPVGGILPGPPDQPAPVPLPPPGLQH